MIITYCDMSIFVPGNYIQIVDDAKCLKIAKRNNSFVMSSPYVARTWKSWYETDSQYKERLLSPKLFQTIKALHTIVSDFQWMLIRKFLVYPTYFTREISHQTRLYSTEIKGDAVSIITGRLSGRSDTVIHAGNYGKQRKTLEIRLRGLRIESFNDQKPAR